MEEILLEMSILMVQEMCILMELSTIVLSILVIPTLIHSSVLLISKLHTAGTITLFYFISAKDIMVETSVCVEWNLELMI